MPQEFSGRKNFPGHHGPRLGRQGSHLDQRLLRRLREGGELCGDGNGHMKQEWVGYGEQLIWVNLNKIRDIH